MGNKKFENESFNETSGVIFSPSSFEMEDNLTNKTILIFLGEQK